ncbi:hypothetical protein ACLMJK_002459 [Lecanora helva]
MTANPPISPLEEIDARLTLNKTPPPAYLSFRSRTPSPQPPQYRTDNQSSNVTNSSWTRYPSTDSLAASASKRSRSPSPSHHQTHHHRGRSASPQPPSNHDRNQIHPNVPMIEHHPAISSAGSRSPSPCPPTYNPFPRISLTIDTEVANAPNKYKPHLHPTITQVPSVPANSRNASLSSSESDLLVGKRGGKKQQQQRHYTWNSIRGFYGGNERGGGEVYYGRGRRQWVVGFVCAIVVVVVFAVVFVEVRRSERSDEVGRDS